MYTIPSHICMNNFQLWYWGCLGTYRDSNVNNIFMIPFCRKKESGLLIIERKTERERENLCVCAYLFVSSKYTDTRQDSKYYIIIPVFC